MKALFDAIDAKDVAGFGSYLADDCLFRFGNMSAVEGRTEVEAFVAGFFDSIDALRHELVDSWNTAEGLVCHGQVTYTRKNGTLLSVPFANVFKMGDGGIKEYLIFADTSALYAE